MSIWAELERRKAEDRVKLMIGAVVFFALTLVLCAVWHDEAAASYIRAAEPLKAHYHPPSRFYTLTGAGALVSTATDAEGALEELEDFGVTPYYGFGFGYKPGWRNLRFEAFLAHHLAYDMRIRRIPPEGGSKYVLRDTRSGSAGSGWLWALADPPNLRWKQVQPFFGVGFGLSYLDVYPDDGFRAAYGLRAGVGITLSQKLALDLGYQYLDLAAFGGRVAHDHHGAFVQLRYGLD